MVDSNNQESSGGKNTIKSSGGIKAHVFKFKVLLAQNSLKKKKPNKQTPSKFSEIKIYNQTEMTKLCHDSTSSWHLKEMHSFVVADTI